MIINVFTVSFIFIIYFGIFEMGIVFCTSSWWGHSIAISSKYIYLPLLEILVTQLSFLPVGIYWKYIVCIQCQHLNQFIYWISCALSQRRGHILSVLSCANTTGPFKLSKTFHTVHNGKKKGLPGCTTMSTKGSLTAYNIRPSLCVNLDISIINTIHSNNQSVDITSFSMGDNKKSQRQ